MTLKHQDSEKRNADRCDGKIISHSVFNHERVSVTHNIRAKYHVDYWKKIKNFKKIRGVGYDR